MRPQRILILIVGIVCILAIAPCVLLIRACFLTQTQCGECASLDAMPLLVNELRPLAPTNLSYIVHQGYFDDPSAYHAVISGSTTEADVKRFCDAHGLEYSEFYPREPTLRQRLLEYAGKQTKIAVDFDQSDGFVFGRTSGLGQVELHYRRADGRFTLSIAK